MAAPSLIGLDIGTMSIRAVETTRSKEGPVATKFGQVPLPTGTVVGGVITDAKAVTAGLKQLWAETRFKGRKVVLGVTHPQIVVREMSVSNLPAKDLRRSLPFQVRDSLPLPVERALLDFFPLEDPGDAETVRGLLIAAPKEAVLTAVEATERAGLHVERVDLASFALLRAASRPDADVEAIVDLGGQITSVVAHVDGVPLIVRTIPRGGAEITDMITARRGIGSADAEQLKRRIGVRNDDEPETVDLIRTAFQPVLNEIRNSFAYLNTGDRHARVARLVLSGGGAQLPGIVDLLGNQLEVPVTIADPTARLGGNRITDADTIAEFRSDATVSIGLALGGAS
jgi:type IV pilus assembly protein PilM